MRALRSAIAASIVGATIALGASSAAAGSPTVQQLVGTLQLTPGTCANGHAQGSYLAVTFGTHAIKNPESHCAGGAETLLSPTAAGLSTQQFTSSASAVFDHHALSLVAASQQLFTPPRIYLLGDRVNADVRSLAVQYNGGQWPIGAQRATGQFDPTTHRLTLQWFSGQSFTPSSAGTEVHLSGVFSGGVRPLAEGTTVNLGSASFAAGGVAPQTQAQGAASTGHHADQRQHRRSHHRGARMAADRRSASSSGTPLALLVAEVLVVLNILAFVGLPEWRARWSAARSR